MWVQMVHQWLAFLGQGWCWMTLGMACVRKRFKILVVIHESFKCFHRYQQCSSGSLTSLLLPLEWTSYVAARGWKRQCIYVRPLYLKENKETVQFFCQCSVSVHSHVVAGFVVCDVLYLLPQPPRVIDCKMVLFHFDFSVVLHPALPKGNAVVSEKNWASLVIKGYWLINNQDRLVSSGIVSSSWCRTVQILCISLSPDIEWRSAG